jgi:two-component system CheB/CheR fusion protein
MGRENEKQTAVVRARHLSWLARYLGSFATVVLAAGIWAVSPLMHRDPFAIFILAVVFTARFLGFGPAVVATILSVVTIDYLAFEPHFSLSLQASDVARLVVFVVISLLAASLARQRSQAEVRADQTMEQMAAIVESSEDAIYSATLDGTLTSWNHGAEALYGYTADEVVGRSVFVTVPSERIHETRSHFEMLARGQGVQTYQTERRRKDNTVVPILLSISPLRNRKGAVIGASAIARDITSQVRAEEALRRNEKLVTAGRLTAAIAHEINNPLEALTNLLYLARRDRSRADQHLEMAEGEIQRIADIAQQTLGFVREVSDARPVNVSSTLEEVLQLYSVKLNAKKIQTTREFEERCEIWGFAGELRQLFSNLIVNATEAVAEGGRLRLRVFRSHEWTAEHRAGVRVVFADNGSGISRADLSRVFEPFYTTKGDNGTGLGLWLSDGIVRKHGGLIRVRSCTHAGKSGTVFSVFLPATLVGQQ